MAGCTDGVSCCFCIPVLCAGMAVTAGVVAVAAGAALTGPMVGAAALEPAAMSALAVLKGRGILCRTGTEAGCCRLLRCWCGFDGMVCFAVM